MTVEPEAVLKEEASEQDDIEPLAMVKQEEADLEPTAVLSSIHKENELIAAALGIARKKARKKESRGAWLDTEMTMEAWPLSESETLSMELKTDSVVKHDGAIVQDEIFVDDEFAADAQAKEDFDAKLKIEEEDDDSLSLDRALSTASAMEAWGNDEVVGLAAAAALAVRTRQELQRFCRDERLLELLVKELGAPFTRGFSFGTSVPFV